MSKSDTQGRAYEYACLMALADGISQYRDVTIIENNPLAHARDCYFTIDPGVQELYDISASAMIDKLFDCEPMIIESASDSVELLIQDDGKGEQGDVRDILIIRAERQWEIGLSVKHNHFAVKHSRLSASIDFGNKWFGVPCSDQYWNDIEPIFDRLREDKRQDKIWNEMPDKFDNVYEPLLQAFIDEIDRAYAVTPDLPERMVEYLLGEFDFYKVISIDKKHITAIETFNLRGTLNQAADVVPRYEIPIAELPTRIIDLGFKPGTQHIVEIYLDNGWAFSFRIHNASTKVEPSLKFDIQMISVPIAIMTINCVW